MTVHRLYAGDAPGAVGTEDRDIPTLTDYGQPGSAARPACVVCPGGAYAMLADHEGKPVAEWFESIGVRAFVLKYRLGPRYHHPTMLHDAERAVRMVRLNAPAWGVDPHRVGVLGFSAGGHLASTLSTHSSPGNESAADPIDRLSSHPDWATLIYPVISMREPNAHLYSREMLLGQHPTPDQIESLSNERAVSLTTPPTFIFHGADDDAVPIQNSLEYAHALADHRVSFEMHVPKHGPHGFGLGEPGSALDWRKLAENWLKSVLK